MSHCPQSDSFCGPFPCPTEPDLGGGVSPIDYPIDAPSTPTVPPGGLGYNPDFPPGGSPFSPVIPVAGIPLTATTAITYTSRTGMTTLMGFPGPEDTGTQQKRYLTTIVSGDMVVMDFEGNATCEYPTCPGSIQFDWQGGVFGFAKEYRLVASLSLVGVAAGVATYLMEGASEERYPPGSGPWFAGPALRLAGLFNGQTGGFFADQIYLVQPELMLLINAWYGVDELKCFMGGLPSIEGYKDHWETNQTMDPNTGVVTGTSTRTRQETVDGMDVGPVLPLPIGCSSPPACYGSGVDVVSTETARTSTGVGCHADGDGTFSEYVGAINESVSNEDTDEDAQNRATVINGSGSTSYQSSRPAGVTTYTFQTVTFSVGYGTQPAGSYNVYGNITSKPHGLAGPITGPVRTLLSTVVLAAPGPLVVTGELPVVPGIDSTLQSIEVEVA